MQCKLTYALTADERIVHISEIGRGNACGCYCPGCGEALVARKGEEKGHHFAHAGGGECKHGFQNSLYYAFKRGVSELPGMALPAYMKNRSLTEEGSGLHVLVPETRIKIQSAEFTRKAGNIITGLLVYCSGRPLLIKIMTQYSAGSGSMEQIKKVGLPVVKIDLSRDDEINGDIVKQYLSGVCDGVFWAYNPKAERIWDEMVSKCTRLSVGGSENAIYTYGCPVSSKRTDGVYCYVKRKCAFCEYFFGLYGYADDRYLLCGRQNVITEAEDIRLSLAQRKKKYSVR